MSEYHGPECKECQPFQVLVLRKGKRVLVRVWAHSIEDAERQAAIFHGQPEYISIPMFPV